MLELDGAAAGGQFVRSALALAVSTGTAVEIENIRGGRSTPGLKAQHLAGIELLADVCDAEVEGAEMGATELSFTPGELTGGHTELEIGTAGSITLLFDTVLPLALELREPLSVTVTGGTDVKWSPSMAFYRQVKLPLLRDYGLQAVVDVDRRGFYPVGGGEATLRLAPSDVDPLRLSSRGDRLHARVYSIASAELAEQSVADRQTTTGVEELEAVGVEVVEQSTTYAVTASPGSVVGVRVDYENSIAGFDALGEPGKPAESVAKEAVKAASEFDTQTAAVDPYMGDQLLLFLALAGGSVSIPSLTEHVATSRELLESFGFDVQLDSRDSTALLWVPE